MDSTVTLTIEQPKRAITSGVLGMVFLLATETMLFAGFISSFIVNRSTVTVCPPVGQPRLPIEITFINTLILLASGVLYALYNRKYKAGKGSVSVISHLLGALALGVTFVSIQGYEWVQLLGYGLTTKSNLYGAYFYMIIGAHALHVMVGLMLLVYLFFFVKSNKTFERISDKVTITGLYWFFVVGIWPLLYYLVYIS